MRINCIVTHQTLAISAPEAAEKSVNYLECAFYFLTPEWQRLTKTAFFTGTDGKNYSAVIQDGTCVVPWESIAEPGFLRMSVAGFGQMSLIITTDIASLRLRDTIFGGDPSQAPSPDQYTQIMQVLSGKVDTDQGVQNAGKVLGINDSGQVEPVEGGSGSSDLLWRPSVSESGDLSWTQDSSTDPPETVNIMGPQGPAGKDGDPGQKGETGATGPAGKDGITPTIGENGNWYLGETDTGKPSRGEQGQRGERGPQGEQGETGEQGPPGKDGTPGQQGEPGPAGQTGPTGPTGATPNIQIGQVTTLEPGQDATASMSGTPENPLLNLGIPKGKNGDSETTVDPEQIKQAVNGYLEENPVSGMTAEQEQQLNQNTTDVADLKSDINEKIDKTGWNPDKFIGTDSSGNIVEKEEPTGGSEYFEVLNNVSSGTLTVGIPPASWNTDNDDWKSVRYGSVLQKFMGGQNVAPNIVNKKVLIPSGTIYIRMAISNIYSTNIGSYSIFAVNSPILPEEYLEEMEVTCEKITEESVTTDFNINDETTKWYIDSDGSIFKYNDTSEANKSIPEYCGGIILKKYVIPEGKYGWLCAHAILGHNTTSNIRWNPAGYPAIFMTDPTDNITQPVNSGEEGESGGQLKPKDEYVEGFMKFIADNSYFQTYFSEYINNFIPLTSKRQTFGKAIYIGGDSLHAYAGGDGFSTSGFVTNWNKYLGFARVTNAGYAGSKWSETTGGGGIKKAKDLISAGTVYDVIILAWGTNDDNAGNGTINDVASDTEGATMVAAMKWIITNLRNTFKSTAIGVIIPPPKGTEDGMKTRGDLMIQVCELLHVPYVDMREYISISDLGSDTVHLGAGAGKYGAAEASLILRICQYGDTLYPGTTD